MRLIDADALVETMAIVAKKMARSDAQKSLMGRVLYILEHKPEVVVRCKDCQMWKRNIGITDSPNGHCFEHDICTNGHDFCSYGERKEVTP